MHVWKAIDHTIILALSYFLLNVLLLTDEYLPHTVLDCKVIDPQATTLSYSKYHFLYNYQQILETLYVKLNTHNITHIGFRVLVYPLSWVVFVFLHCHRNIIVLIIKTKADFHSFKTISQHRTININVKNSHIKLWKDLFQIIYFIARYKKHRKKYPRQVSGQEFA